MAPFVLPMPLQRRIGIALNHLLQPPGAAVQDFSMPPGEAALIPPESLSWQVFKNPVTTFIGGVAAVILELAEPRVRTGVWEHTSFRDRPVQRMQRTWVATMMHVYGPRGRTEQMIAAVTRRHAAISGVTPGGAPYCATDPELLRWVHATALFGFMEAAHAYVKPVCREERDRFFSEGMEVARLYGVPDVPTSAAQMNRLFDTMQPRLERSAIVRDFLRIVRAAPLLPGLARPVQSVLVGAAVEITPGRVRERLGLDASWGLASWQRLLVCTLARRVDGLLLHGSPPVQACRRLGLPDDYLYTRRAIGLGAA